MVPEAQAFFDAVGGYVARIRSATGTSALPTAFPDETYHGLRLIYRRNGQGFVVMIASVPDADRFQQQRALEIDARACGTYRIGTLAQARRAGLYVPTWHEHMSERLAMGFSPQLGFYTLPPLIDEPALHYAPLPAQPPADPFALNASAECTDEIRPAAAAFLDSLRRFADAYFAHAATLPATDFDVQTHSNGTHPWLQVMDESGFLDTLMPCLVLHSAPADNFKNLGVPTPLPGALYYTPSLGLYVFS